ncbi:MAG: lipopolysaccharide biosynthesis protein [Eggerthellaceae bacterium]|nr:lipopolysaccharide biosynthesis protein [Eggerthellaceae bacterium]
MAIFKRHDRADGGKDPGKPAKVHRPNFLARTVNGWFNRIIGAAASGSFGGQEELYAAHRTSRDYLWNTVAIATWGFVFPLLTIIVTQLVGVELGGMFSMAFVVGSLLMFIGNYGMRTYQVSDIEEKHSFSDYQINRWLTCAVMVAVGVLYGVVRGYAQDMFMISMGVYLYKMVDGLADVYEGRLQQMDKLYLAGISLVLRSVLVIVVFAACLLITKNLPAACIAMAVAAAVSFIVITFPLALLETPKSRKFRIGSIATLFKNCFPLFIALFSYALIDSMPRLIMESTLSYDNQLYFYVMCFPATATVLIVGFIYKPQLLRMANMWADPKRHRQFNLTVVAVFGAIAIVTAAMVFFVAWVGIAVMGFLYGIDLEQFRGLFFVMLAAGGVMAAIDFLYQVITVLRKQMAVMKLYLITFGFSLFIPFLLINFTGLPGAVLSYLIIMSILLVLLVMDFFRIRAAFAHEQELENSRERRQELRRSLQGEEPPQAQGEQQVQNMPQGQGVQQVPGAQPAQNVPQTQDPQPAPTHKRRPSLRRR